MRYKLIIEYDSDTRKTTITDPDAEKVEGTGVLILLGNNPEEGLCYNSTMGDMRSVAESFACLAGDENPRSQRVIAFIKERMRRNNITSDEALKMFEADCKCQGKCHCHLRLVN